ncbi:MAG: isocitrate/isopropylmalate family dehydrogenase [Micropruina glycogenica]
MDFVVVREGTEGLYCGVGGSMQTGTPFEVANEVSVNTARGVERVIRDAFERAMRRRKKVTWCTSTTCWSTRAGCGTASSGRSPTSTDVTTDYLHVDATTIMLVQDPSAST